MNSKANSSAYGLMTDIESLNCPYCCDRLTIPTYQCLNRHVACSICWPKLSERCPQCSVVLGNSRCRSIENVITTLFVRCPNQIYGCTEVLPYADVHKHINDACRHSQCYCPLINTYNYNETSSKVFAHYVNFHTNKYSQKLLAFGYEQEAVVKSLNSVSVYYCIGTDVLFILQTFRLDDGIYITIAYIGDEESVFERYSYKIRYINGDNIFSRHTLKMKGISKVSYDRPEHGSYMYIPNGYFGGPHLSLHLCITKFEE